MASDFSEPLIKLKQLTADINGYLNDNDMPKAYEALDELQDQIQAIHDYIVENI